LRTSRGLAFLGSAEPRKLRVQRRDGLGRGLEQRTLGHPTEYGSAGLGLVVGQQARPPVAGLSVAAARANPPQLRGRLVEEEVGKVGHGAPFGMTIHPVERAEKQEK